jgi:integrase
MRARTGTLIAKPSGFFARVWVKLTDGTEARKFLPLGTKNRATAKRKLAKLVAEIAAGEHIEEAAAKVQGDETYRSYTLDRHEQRKAAGIGMARDEQWLRTTFAYPVIGDVAMRQVTDDQIREILERAREADMGYESVKHLRSCLRRDFKRARIDKVIEHRPAEDVEMPEGVEKDKRPFISPTDDEMTRYLGASVSVWGDGRKLDLECKLAALVARTEGGTRTAELVRWDWTMIDLVNFTSCKILRAKTHDVQELEVPEVLRPFLAAWHARAGRPQAGPVFPVRRGRRVGQQKKERGTSFAGRLRRDFFRAGVVRLPAVKAADGSPAPNPADPIYFDTRTSRRMNFHSLRRAYSRALARADVSMQTAMTLTSHATPGMHMVYVREAEAARPVPLAALPVVDPALAAGFLSPAVTNGPKRRAANATKTLENEWAGQGSNLRPSACKADALPLSYPPPPLA